MRCHTVINAWYLFFLLTGVTEDSFTGLKDAVRDAAKGGIVDKRRAQDAAHDRVHSVAIDQDTGKAFTKAQLVRKFVNKARDVNITGSRINRTFGLIALLVCEDLPMMILNIMIIDEYRGENSRVPILLSMTIGTMMVAFKMSAVYNLADLKTVHSKNVKEAVDLLDELDKFGKGTKLEKVQSAC